MTEAELAAARAFRAAQRDVLKQKNASEPPDIIVSVFIRHYRHDCVKQGGKSVSLELREHYVLSPAYFFFKDGLVLQTARPDPFGPPREVLDKMAARGLTELTAPEAGAAILAGRFGWIFTEGRCPACKMTARSGTGRLVDPETRPAANGQARH